MNTKEKLVSVTTNYPDDYVVHDLNDFYDDHGFLCNFHHQVLNTYLNRR